MGYSAESVDSVVEPASDADSADSASLPEDRRRRVGRTRLASSDLPARMAKASSNRMA